MALTGNEVLDSTGQQSNGAPGATIDPIKTRDIAALAIKGRGTFTANGATPVTVAFSGMTAATTVVFGLNTVGGTVGAYPTIKTVTAGTGFTVAATASDTSVYNWAAL